jgi:uncharacterized protein (TIGR02246 family)
MFRVPKWLAGGVSVCGLMVLAACNTAPQQPAQPVAAPDTRAADEAAIRAVIASWASIVAAKDAAAWAAVYTDDARVYVPGGEVAAGKDAITKSLTGLVAAPGFALTFVPAKITVARAGDFAYEEGDFAMTMNDKKGKPQTEKGKYVVVWEKQADGKWKALIDAPTASH